MLLERYGVRLEEQYVRVPTETSRTVDPRPAPGADERRSTVRFSPSELHGPVSDPFVALRIEGDVGLSLVFKNVKRIFNTLAIEALLEINAPLWFEGLRSVDLVG